ncbi:unnamed protein product [Cuscuta epithymum]|uniref:Uncharacterized protein n=1 Tax=Cuscuta epithymum TaxID=186058 RepID=A0AAV0F5M3_9ASTE|nr:unnamed protein product [Cuscuta epithymum]
MVLTMPSYTSIERRVTMKAFGVDLIVTDPTKGMSGTVPKAYHLVESAPNAFMLQQFSNPTNTQARVHGSGVMIQMLLPQVPDIFFQDNKDVESPYSIIIKALKMELIAKPYVKFVL